MSVAAQSQFLNFQDLSFHGVSVSMRHCPHRSGGQWLRREVSLISGSSARRTIRCRVWRVALLIISTNSDLSTMTRPSRKAPRYAGLKCSQQLNDSLRQGLEVEGGDEFWSRRVF